jgi:hypothetical protein
MDALRRSVEGQAGGKRKAKAAPARKAAAHASAPAKRKAKG